MSILFLKKNLAKGLRQMKTCPLCNKPQPEYWPNGDIKMDDYELASFRLMGYSLLDIQTAISYAISRGWKSETRNK